MYASGSCIRIVMIRDGLVFAADKSQGVDAPVASAFGPEQMTLTNTPDSGKHEPEASSVPAVSPVATLSLQHLTWQSQSDKRYTAFDIGLYCLIKPLYITIHYVSKAEGATAITTTRLATISAPATNETTIILPLEAGNLPRIT